MENPFRIIRWGALPYIWMTFYLGDPFTLHVQEARGKGLLCP